MPRLIILYGGHGADGDDPQTVYEDIVRLFPHLQTAMTLLRSENNDIISIIEYNGPSPDQIPSHVSNLRGWFNNFKTSIREYIEVINQTGNCHLGIPFFEAILGRYYHQNGIEIVLQDPEFDDWEYYIENFSSDGNDRDAFVRSIQHLEEGFIRQVISLSQERDNLSFLIVRGDFHSDYYSQLRDHLINDGYEFNRIDY